jgi:peptide/nickel transport system substrate-binding protein
MPILRKGMAPALAVALLAMPLGGAFAQKAGGTFKVYHRDTPPSGSIHEEATNSTVIPYMGVYNNLVVFDQQVAINSLDSIVPDLATDWSWDDSKTKLTFNLRSGVTWHDDKPFTSADVKCTWDQLLGNVSRDMRLRKNPRKSWYWNLKEITTDGDTKVTFHLGQPQPAFLALLASGYSPVYPCHVDPKTMRTNPIGTGPFKFVELKQNESIKLVKNENYWKEGRPYLDGIDFTIIKSRSTRVLAFVAGEFDMTYPVDITVPLMKDIKNQAPDAICDLVPTNVSRNLIVNRDAPPFDDERIRTAMALAIDRQAFVDILSEGEDDVGGALLPPPGGVWGLPPEELAKVPGYGDVAANREKARALMQEAGYGPDKRLNVTVSTRNIAIYRDPAVILIDHLKEIYIDAELKIIETSNWHATVARKDYQIGMNLTGTGVDDPDVVFFEGYACTSERNYTGYCNKELEALFLEQSKMEDQEERKKLVWQIDAKLQEDVARPTIFHATSATCRQPYVNGYVQMTNSSYNGFRFEDVWLDK